MKPNKKVDPYVVEDGGRTVKEGAPGKAEPEAATGTGGAPAAAGGKAALFSACLVDEVHVISFSRPDVLDAAYIERLGDDIYHHLKPIEEPRVVIDLDNVEYLSSSALGMLIALKRVVEKKDGRICIANVRDQLMQVFKLTKLHKALKIHGSVDKAIKSLS